MLTVYDFLGIRTSHANGESIRSIARRLKHSQRSIRKVIDSPTGEPVAYLRSEPSVAPKLGAFYAVIDQILADDESAPPKQRHTAARVFARLRGEHGYAGQYDQVRRYVKQKRGCHLETFVPLPHALAERVECDFGQIWVDFPASRRAVSVLILTWSVSHASFMIALPTQRTEAILHGMTAALSFFGCVPKEMWWDNPKTVAAAIFIGRDRRANPHYAAMASHYRFDPLFCMVRKGQEKCDVESSVRGLQKRFATPVPQALDYADLNQQLLGFCITDRQRTVSGRSQTIDVNFEAEKRVATVLPSRVFDACLKRELAVDKYQSVTFDHNRYSVPRQQAFLNVTLKAYVDEIHVVYKGAVVAKHKRSYGECESILDPLHYLATLDRKPAWLDHTDVFRNWHLPASFAELRKTFEAHHGLRTGDRHYIRVLQLLTAHSVERIARAIERCRHQSILTAESIADKARQLAAKESSSSSGSASYIPQNDSTLDPLIALRVTVPAVDLRMYDRLLTTLETSDANSKPSLKLDQAFTPGEPDYVRPTDDAAQAQPQDAATAGDAVGIQQTLA